jgi:RNA polymerase sigma-70 factor (ECF subfamily)
MGSVDVGFRALFDSHFGDLWRFARRRVGSAADADEVVAETFAVAWRRRDQLPEGDDARLWLFGVARNVVANHRRSETRRRRLHLRLVARRAGGAEAAVVAGPEVPDAVPDGVRAAFDALGGSAREVMIMRHWDGLAVHEIATLLGCTPNAVSLRLHKAKHRLTELLAEKDPAPSGQVTGDPEARKEQRHA